MARSSINPPTVFIIGAAKTGTSWLQECFKEHPETYASPTGELDYFSFNYEKGKRWYESHFVNSLSKKLSLDNSPSYFTDLQVARRIYNYDPSSTIILIVRHPLERAYSHYCMHLRGGIVSRDIDREIQEGTRYVEDSLYFKYLAEYLKYFPENQIIVKCYDSLVKDPKSYFQALCQDLSIDSSFTPKMILRKYHQRKGVPENQRLYNYIVKTSSRIYKNPKLSYLSTVIDKFRKSSSISLFHKIVGSEMEFPQISKSKEEQLMSLFCKDLHLLEQVTGNNYSVWEKKKLNFITRN